jgi:hypothetical protein
VPRTVAKQNEGRRLAPNLVALGRGPPQLKIPPTQGRVPKLSERNTTVTRLAYYALVTLAAVCFTSGFGHGWATASYGAWNPLSAGLSINAIAAILSWSAYSQILAGWFFVPVFLILGKLAEKPARHSLTSHVQESPRVVSAIVVAILVILIALGVPAGLEMPRFGLRLPDT